MNTLIDLPLEKLTLTTLLAHCTQEMRRYRRRELNDDRYCLELFRRALVERREDAWEMLYIMFYDSACLWFRCHPSKMSALRYDSEKSYVDDAFKRLWQWSNNQQEALLFTSLAGALKALHLCLHSAIMDVLRAYARPREEPIPDYGLSDDPTFLVEDLYHQDEWWEIIASILTNERERRVIYLLYHCGLKPREIIHHCPGEFSNEQEIYRLTRNSLDRLRRNADKLRWKLVCEI